jgi:pimeloyl-ACP methyl ester carboxylesterase
MGGFIALQFALDYPEKLSALVLMDTRSSGVGDVPEYVGLRRKLHQIAWTEGLGAAFEYEAARNPMSREYFQKYPEQREISRQKMLRTSVRGYVYAGEAILEWASVTAQLPRIAVPTLVIVGEEDKFLRQPCEVIAAAIPGARLVVIPGVGHSPQEEAPQIFNHHLLSFLSQVEQPAA